MDFKNLLLVPQVKAQIVNSKGDSNLFLQHKSTSLPFALWFLIAAVSVNPGTTCRGRGTERCFCGRRPGSTSSFCLSCCAYVSSGCLGAAPLSSFWMGAGDGGSCAGHPWGCGSRGGVQLWSRVTAATRSAGGKSRAEFKVAGGMQSASEVQILIKKNPVYRTHFVKPCIKYFIQFSVVTWERVRT